MPQIIITGLAIVGAIAIFIGIVKFFITDHTYVDPQIEGLESTITRLNSRNQYLEAEISNYRYQIEIFERCGQYTPPVSYAINGMVQSLIKVNELLKNVIVHETTEGEFMTAVNIITHEIKRNTANRKPSDF